MTLVPTKASCFVNSCEIAFSCDAATIARDYKDLVGASDHDPDEEGYHPSVVNMAFLERYGRGLTQIDVRPVLDDEQFSADVPGYVTDWFKRPQLQAVCTGLKDDGSPHAIAYRNGRFFDSTGVVLEEPSITIQYVWVLGLPAFIPDAGVEEGGAE